MSVSYDFDDEALRLIANLEQRYAAWIDVVCGLDGQPCRLIAPDPRCFALHKLWLADKGGRNPLKKPKDERQGALLLSAIAQRMPH